MRFLEYNFWVDTSCLFFDFLLYHLLDLEFHYLLFKPVFDNVILVVHEALFSTIEIYNINDKKLYRLEEHFQLKITF